MNTARRRIGSLILCTTLLCPQVVAQTVRYQGELPGDVTLAGNSLGLAKQTSANGPGNRGSIGTFITDTAALVDNVPANPGNPWGPGTTGLWQLNGSTDDLDLPAGATVVYAELVWGGSWSDGVEDVSASLDVAVTLDGPLGGSLAVAPDPTTAQTLSSMSSAGFAVRYYLRSADVTAFVAAQGGGDYATRGVPATQNELLNSLNAAGWALIVAYADASQPNRYLSIVVDGRFVDEGVDVDVTFTGLCTPASGAVTGRALVVALEGDADLVGDDLWIRADAGLFAVVAGPTNPAGNVFASQVNDALGVLDTSGTYGALNHDPLGASNTIGGRQGWDTTGLALDSAFGQLANSQSSATLRATTTGDTSVLMASALSVAQPVIQAYCTAGTTASGCQAQLSAAGVASATASTGFTLQASAVEGAKDGLFFFAANGRQANAWGNGTSFQCVAPPVNRAGLLAASGTSGLCDGAFAQDLNALWCPTCPKPGKNPGAGAVVQAQLWFRDPLNTSNQTTSLSNAAEFCVRP